MALNTLEKSAKKSTVAKLPIRAMPKGWHHWSSDAKTQFDLGVDEKVTFKGQKSACIEVRKAVSDSTVWMMQNFEGQGYRGKRIRLTAHVRTKDVAKTAVISLCVFGPGYTTLALDNMADRPISGTTEWTKCELVLDVPQTATTIRFAGIVAGQGAMYISGISFEEVDLDVPRTDNYALGCRGVWVGHPVNMDFSKNEIAKYLNDDFVGVLPKAWLQWGTKGRVYEIGADEAVAYTSKRSACIKSLVSVGESDYGWLFQKFGAPSYRGKRVRFTAYTKTSKVKGHCGLHLCVMDIVSNDLFSENAFDLDGAGTHDWTKHEIVVDVPHHAGVISIGAQLSGNGKFWLDGLKFEEVDLDVPVTISQWKVFPKNLSFEQT
jgi:hypothetical protein